MKRILIIDDSKAVREDLREKIHSFVCGECKIFEAENGIEGIKIAEKEKPDIVFVDVVMPYFNGYATAIRLKNMEDLNSTILIAMTSMTDSEVEKKMLALCHDFISKPIKSDALKNIIWRYFRKKDVKRKDSVDMDSFDAITNELVLSLQEKVEELTSVNNELRNKNKTIENLYRETENARKKLEALVNFRQDFLDFIFHEIKGPLSSILGYSELLQIKYFRELEEEGNRLIESVISSGLRIKDLMEQVSRFNNFDFEIKSNILIKVSDAIDEVLLRYQPFISERELKVFFDCSKDIRLKLNRDFLIEIIDPILRNAIIFNRKNGSIKIACRKEDERVIVVIGDTGIGMTEKEVEQAFVPFVQFIDVEHYKSHSLKGLGLGLSMCKKMVDMVGGMLLLTSEKGVGTKVEIVLPERV